MDFNSFDNFLLIPLPEKPGYACFYELIPTMRFAENAFVLIPYPNSKGTVDPKFFLLKNKQEVPLPPAADGHVAIQLTGVTPKNKYLETLYKLKQHIQRGDIYEINYCIRFFAQGIKMNPAAVFSKLHALAKAPYSSFLKIGDEVVLCASPELFLKKNGPTLSSKPIKGTIKRGKSTEEDAALKEELYTNIKERTENVMAVDVARNDLSQLATKGSVKVNKLYNIESFETVHQMVSTVSCELKKGTSFEKILAATFPMASMTGAPKLKARQLIDVYEDFDRGYYSGAMGLIDENGDFVLSVIIRSIFYNQASRELSLAVGGAITYLCDPEREYEECLLKAKALLTALNATIS